MTISYNWLKRYLPIDIEPEKLSQILTAIGLEVESLEEYNTIKGGLNGLVVGEVLTREKHPDADKLSLTTVDVGGENILQIVCGAPNVSAGQKVIVATNGTTIYPSKGEPFTIKKAKIRGVESNGMICAEDEIGLGEGHDGIMVLDAGLQVGTKAASLFDNYQDFVYEIGLTPNRMDAMSHRGVAKDVLAYLVHHENPSPKLQEPTWNFEADSSAQIPIDVVIENETHCKRYCGAYITNATVTDSPAWLQNLLKAIGLKPINNIVDITNFILHDTGQPLHAFDADKIDGKKVTIKNLAKDTPFVTLDNKNIKLSDEDLMVCDGAGGMCIAGVYGGLHSGVTKETKNIFLESAWFAPKSIRKTSLRHGLRTDAATRFEKGVDIGNSFNVLQRAAAMIAELSGGKIVGEAIDLYPTKITNKQIVLSNSYLKKLSGKNYPMEAVASILKALDFEIVQQDENNVTVKAPLNKPDIEYGADLVEEIMRIDGLDNVVIPDTISMAPSVENDSRSANFKEKIANLLTGFGFYEIFTNSITNSKYYQADTLQSTVKMLNNLSTDLDVMRPQMLQTGLEVVAHNLNRKNSNLKLFEFGKTYRSNAEGKYDEQKHLSLFVTGNITDAAWNQKNTKADVYYLKGSIENILKAIGIVNIATENLDGKIAIRTKNKVVANLQEVDKKTLHSFGLKEVVFYADILWDEAMGCLRSTDIQHKDVSKFPSVERDLAIVVDKAVTYAKIEEAIRKAKVSSLQSTKLFDVFESDKLGAGKKSLAVNFVFADEQKTLTDIETERFMQEIIKSLEKQVAAEIRK